MGRFPVTSPEQRFWGKVERGPRCWLWTARVDRDGYGAFSVSRSTIVRAHRLSWELHRGEVPPTACVLHLCGERRCVNPEHLYLGSAHDCDRSPRPSPPPPRARRVRRRVPRGDSHWTHRQAGKIRRGARSHLSKLTADQVREIRALHARNLPIKDLAA